MRMQVVVTLNAAFCERHRKLCPPSEELDRECGKVGAGVSCGIKGSRCHGSPYSAALLLLLSLALLTQS
jgi:hypothetical protein